MQRRRRQLEALSQANRGRIGSLTLNVRGELNDGHLYATELRRTDRPDHRRPRFLSPTPHAFGRPAAATQDSRLRLKGCRSLPAPRISAPITPLAAPRPPEPRGGLKMSDIIDHIKGAAGKLVLAKSDTEKLAQIRSEIGEAEVELKRLDEERGRWIVGQVAGEPDAIAAIMPADRDATALHRRLTDPRPGRGRTGRRHTTGRGRLGRTGSAEQAARPGRARGRVLNHAREINAAADALAAAVTMCCGAVWRFGCRRRVTEECA